MLRRTLLKGVLAALFFPVKTLAKAAPRCKKCGGPLSEDGGPLALIGLCYQCWCSHPPADEWKNYTVGYKNLTKEEWKKRMREAMRNHDFQPPIEGGYVTTESYDSYRRRLAELDVPWRHVETQWKW